MVNTPMLKTYLFCTLILRHIVTIFV